MLNAVQDKTTLDMMFDFLVLITSLGDKTDTTHTHRSGRVKYAETVIKTKSWLKSAEKGKACASSWSDQGKFRGGVHT